MSPEAVAFFAAMAAAPQQIALPLPERRAAGEHAEDATAEPAGVTFQPAPEVGGLWAVPDRRDGPADVLYLFGGGYVLGSPASRRKTAGHIAAVAGGRVLVPNYRLAPEHPFPAALDDAVAAFRFLAGNPGGPGRTVIAGDSAGGGLAVACGLAIRDAGGRGAAGIVALSPWADLTCSGETMTLNATRDIECTRAGLLDMAGMYLHGHDAKDPHASPVFGHFDGTPPLLAVVGGEEVLLDDSVRLVRSAALAGCDARLSVVAGMQHVFPIWCGAFPEASRGIAEIGAFIRSLG